MDLKVELRGKEQCQSDPVREGLVWPLLVLKTEGATNQGMQDDEFESRGPFISQSAGATGQLPGTEQLPATL